MLGNMSKLVKVINKLSSWHPQDDDKSGEDKDKQMSETEDRLTEYNPMIPGNVLYCYR